MGFGRARAGAVLAAVGLVLAACGSDDAGGATASEGETSGGRIKVVTTVSPLTNIAANIGGDLVEIDGVVPEGTNSHTFEPPPSVAEVLAEADLIFINGLKLEDPTLDLAEKNKQDDAKIVQLGDEVLPEDDYIFDFSFPEDEGKPNPHLWTDPTYAKKYAEVIKDELSAADPDNAEAFAKNYDEYAKRIDAFDAALREASDSLPAEDRKLVTYHDAYAYFAKTYGWKVVGAIQVESFEDPTPREVADLIDQVKGEGVKAVFGSEVFPSPVLEQIGKEAGVRYVDDLRDDDLPGEPGDDEHTLLSLLRFNFTTMIDALGGDASALEDVDVSDVTTDEATYPQ